MRSQPDWFETAWLSCCCYFGQTVTPAADVVLDTVVGLIDVVVVVVVVTMMILLLLYFVVVIDVRIEFWL